MTAPTKDTLLALLKRKGLNELASDLEKGKTTFEEMMAFSKEDWEKYFMLNGIYIYNHLHPPPLVKAMDIDQQTIEGSSDINQSTASSFNPPARTSKNTTTISNHGKRWTREEIKELDRMIRRYDITVEEIARHFGRSKSSIELKAASIAMDQKNSENDLKIYRDKIGNAAVERYLTVRQRDLSRKRKLRLLHYLTLDGSF